MQQNNKKIDFHAHSNIPKKQDSWWQFSILPELTIYREKGGETFGTPYTVINFAWLFWDASLIIN